MDALLRCSGIRPQYCHKPGEDHQRHENAHHEFDGDERPSPGVIGRYVPEARGRRSYDAEIQGIQRGAEG